MSDQPGSDREPGADGATRVDLAVAAVLMLCALGLRLFLVFQTSAPLGLDGYYYAVQVRSLLQTGTLYYPAMPFGFWLLSPFAAVTDPIVGVKIGSALLTALATPAVFMIVRSFARSRAHAVLGGLLAASSPGSLMLTGEFVKQGIGLTLVLWTLAIVANARSRRAWIAASIFGLACLTTHGTSAVLAAWFVAPVVLARIRGLKRAAVLAVVSLSAGAVLWRYRHLLHDLASPSTSGGDAPIETRLAALVAVGVILLALVVREDRSWIPVVVGAATFGLAINLPFVNSGGGLGLGPRLQLMAFVPIAICTPALVFLSLRRGWTAIVAAGLLTPISLLAAREVVRLRYEPSDALSGALRQFERRLPPDAIVIAQEHSTAFQVKWFTGIETVSVEPDVIDPSRTYRLLSTGISKRIKDELATFEQTAGDAVQPTTRSGGSGYDSLVLVPEPTWRAFLKTLPGDLRATVDPWPSRRGN